MARKPAETNRIDSKKVNIRIISTKIINGMRERIKNL